MAQTKIEWTEYSWNPVTGCTKISAGCANCYAERMAHRLHAMGNPRYAEDFNIKLHPDLINLPLKWKAPRVIFVNSMSDVFHEEIPSSFIHDIFKTMNDSPQHTFQILTKRSDRLLKESKNINWTHNIWMGVTVENSNYIQRIKHLQSIKARVKFISCEPLIGPILNLPLKNIDWVIVGGESGHGSRKMEREWAITIRDQCLKNNVPYFFKQWGGYNKHKNGRLLDGCLWDQMPNIIKHQNTLHNKA